MARHGNYDKFPVIISGNGSEVTRGWREIGEHLRGAIASRRRAVVCVECYPGAFETDIEHALTQALRPAELLRAAEQYKSASAIDAMLFRHLGDDPVFGRMNDIQLGDFFDPEKLATAQTGVKRFASGVLLVIGTGASLIATEPDVLVYTDMSRWEIQLRQRRNEIPNLGVQNCSERPALQYKRAFFVDWRAADRLKKQLLLKLDFLLDTNDRANPKMISGDAFRRALSIAAHRPFRVVPYFDPGPWGGHWMEEVCDLPTEKPNHAWCFDCVPEENSLMLGFGDVRVEVPAVDLVFAHPRELLGDAVHGRFGTEFPIRFDFLDTMGGGNLSFQVHPLTEYIQDKFGMNYTQDESYYLLDSQADGSVYLGLKEGVDRAQMIRELRAAANGGPHFEVEKFVNKWPAKKHDHFLIPAGTVHCSGRNSMVLEISATPYIFTFKLWDWGRMGLDGRPRPTHIDHAEANIQWDRTTDWVRRELVNHIELVQEGPSWKEERTGLHQREFIETRRHWFTSATPHDSRVGVNVLNLVEGEEATVESPEGEFGPFAVHYAETFIVPAAVGPYTIRPSGPSEGKRCATIKAYVRTNP